MIELKEIDRRYGIIVEGYITQPVMEYDYETLMPVVERKETIVEVSFKIKGEVKKTKLYLAHFIALYRNAKKEGIEVGGGKGYAKAKKSQKFDLIEYAGKVIKESEEKEDVMFC